MAVWLDADTSDAESAVQAAHPEVQWLAGRPLATTLEQARAIRAELWEARSAVYAEAAASFEAEVATLGGSVGYASTSAPLVFVDLPAPIGGRPRDAVRGSQPGSRGGVAGDDDVGRPDRRRQLDERQR